MKMPNRDHAAMAKWLRKNSLHPAVKPSTRAKAVRAAKMADKLAKMQAKKAQEQEQAAESATVSKGGSQAPSRDQLYKIFYESSQSDIAHLREDLNHTHMIALADMFDGWAQGERRTPEQSAKIMGWAESLRHLADEVGPSWNPPEPERLCAIGFLARRIVREP